MDLSQKCAIKTVVLSKTGVTYDVLLVVIKTPKVRGGLIRS